MIVQVEALPLNSKSKISRPLVMESCFQLSSAEYPSTPTQTIEYNVDGFGYGGIHTGFWFQFYMDLHLVQTLFYCSGGNGKSRHLTLVGLQRDGP